jgi:hypothetical protein
LSGACGARTASSAATAASLSHQRWWAHITRNLAERKRSEPQISPDSKEPHKADVGKKPDFMELSASLVVCDVCETRVHVQVAIVAPRSRIAADG